MSSVAVLTPVFPPYRGGIGRVAQADAEQLASLGHQVTVYVPAGKKPRPADQSAAYAIREVRPLFRYGNAALVPQLGGVLRRHDVTLLHYPFFGGAEAVALAAKRRGAGALLIMYHMDVVGSGAKAAVFKTHEKFFAPAILAAADGVIVTSRDYASHSPLLSRVRSRVPFFELAPSVATDEFAPAEKDPALLARHGLHREDVIVTFVGGLDAAHYFKGLPVLFEAMASLGDTRCKLIIIGQGDARPSFEARARELGIGDRVIFAGAVPDNELASYFRLGDFFVFPSTDKSEAFGIAALESLACGVPVIASALPGVRTIVRPGETGMLVRPADVEALADAMARMASDSRLRTRLVEGARMLALRYSVGARTVQFGRILQAVTK